MLCQPSIPCLVRLVQHQVDEVKTRQQCRWQHDVFDDAQSWVVAALYRVGRRQYTGAGIQGGNDARLGNRDGLLLHHFMQL